MTKDVTIQTDEVLETLVHWYEASEQATVDSRAECERDRDYRNGIQWTAEEVAALNKRKQPVITIDRIGPKVDFLLGMEQQHRTDPRAYPRTPNEEDAAGAATDALRYVMEDQNWDATRSDCFDNHIVEGSCGVDVRVVEKYGEPCIEVLQIPWDRMFGDPHSRRKDWSDGKYKGQFLWMDFEDARERWPDKVEALETTLASESATGEETYGDIPRVRWSDPKRKRVRVVEIWSKEGGKVFHSIFTKAGVLERQESPYLNEDKEPDDGFVFGSCFIDRDGNRFGVVRRWISLQDEINKRRSKALHLMSVRQVKLERGAVDDVNKVRQELAKPDGVVEVTPNMMFEVLETGDMEQSQFNLLQEAKQEIDAVGVNAALSGDEQRNMSGRALIARSEQGMAELGPAFDSFRQFQHAVYRKVWNRIRQFWTAEKWIRVTDDEKNVKFVGLNQPLTLGEQLLDELKKQGQRITPEMEMQAKMDPRMQQVVGVRNHIAELDVDIVIDDVPSSASLQGEQFEALVKIAPQAATMPPPLFKALIQASSLRNKNQILESLEGKDEQESPEVQQLKAQLQMMGEELQKLQAQAMDKSGDLQLKAGELQLKEREMGLKEREIALKEAETQLKLLEVQNKGSPELESLRQQIENEAKELQHARELFERDKRIAMLELKAGATAAQHAEERANNAATEVTRATQEKPKENEEPKENAELKQLVQIVKAMQQEAAKPKAKVTRIERMRNKDGKLVGAKRHYSDGSVEEIPIQ